MQFITDSPKIWRSHHCKAGQVPRRVEVERKRRIYANNDLNSMLDNEIQRLCDSNVIFAGAEDSIPVSIQFLDMTTQNLPLARFDDISFDCHPNYLWKQMIDGTGGVTVRCWIQGTWQFGKALSYDLERNSVSIKIPHISETESFELPRMFVCFDSENPEDVTQRISSAIQARAEAESVLLFHLCVDCMPVDNVPSFDSGQVSKILHLACATLPTKGGGAPDSVGVIHEASLQFMRTMNMLQLLHEGRKLMLPNAESDPILSSLRWDFIFKSLQSRQSTEISSIELIPQASMTLEQALSAFSFKTMLTSPESICVMQTVEKENITLMSRKFFTGSEKFLKLEEFMKLQTLCTNETVRYIRDVWMGAIIKSVKIEFQNFYKGWLNLNESNTEVYNFSKIKRFLQMLNFKMEDVLRFFITNQLSSFVMSIDDACNNRANHALLFVDLVMVVDGDGKRVFTTTDSGNIIAKHLTACIEHIFTSIHDIVRIEKSIMTRLFWGTEPKMSVMSIHEDVVQESIASVARLMNHSMEQVQMFCESFSRFEQLVSVDVDIKIESYVRENSDENGIKIAELKRLALDHLRERDLILTSVAEEVVVGPIIVKCQNIRKLLAKKHQDVHDKLILTLVNKVRLASERVVEGFKGILSRITRRPNTIEELVELKEYIAQNVPQQYLEFKQASEKAYVNYSILDSLKLQVTASDISLKWEAFGWPKKLSDILHRLDYDLEMLKERLLGSMQDQKGEFSERLRAIRTDISNLQSQYDISRVSQISSRVRTIQRELEKADEEARIINSREGLFGKDITDFAEITEVKKLLEPFADLWTSVDSWLISQREWKEGPFLDLDAELIEKQVSILSKNLNKAFKSFERNQQTSCCKIAGEFRDRVNEFKPYVPLIVALRNPGMKERHWNLLTEKTGISIQVNPNLTLSKLVAKGIVDQITIVSKISETAAKEYSIEVTLEKMENAWKSMILIIDPYRSTGTCILKGIDDLITLLDEQITTTQAMAFSAFKGPFGERIDLWNECLGRVSEVVEEWIQVQRSWLYLQPIFDSDDINRQLPQEGKRFSSVDKFWRQTMSSASKEVLAIRFCNDQRLLDKLGESNRILELVQKGLSDYLETKRAGFSRFYFLSNDELLEILSESKDPLRVQPHLKKCFEGIKSVDFANDLIITGMNSAEGEKIFFDSPIDPKGKNVESWMVEVNDAMIGSIKSQMGQGIANYFETVRTDWVQHWPGQVVLNGSQVHWTREVEEKIKAEGNQGVQDYADQLSSQLSDMVILIRGKLSKMARITIGALAVIDVHARDVVRNMANLNVSKVTDFDWISQMRFYWEGIGGDFDLKVVMVSSKRNYGYEYLGNTPRLVITPLTDKCYLTLMGALQMILGGAPAGPAGTGKTETVKDLSKALAKQCVVFNCSDGLDYLAMGKFFKGLANCGAWSCFDEFNRINIEVLSVIAQQIMTLQGAVQRKEKRIVFEGTDIIVSPEFAVFITMNPGYAGRTELPDNLEALFRPVAMMVPDYVLIAEISLFSYGYMENRKCAEKMVATFRLCSEQLSSQDHYDYGMRAVKTVITAAGNLKRVSPDENEESLLLRALQDVNIPKFLAHDLPLFSGILSDLFPGTLRPAFDYGPLLRCLKSSAEKDGLQPVPNFLKKNIELYEMICVRHGLMVVGPTGGGKSKNINILKDALTSLSKEGIKGVRFDKVQKHELNPKSVTMGQLYGEFDVNTHEWRDGVLCGIVRDCIKQQNTELKWIVFAGPVDALWIENMNTVLDDNKKLCLTSGEIMSLSEEMTMMFEPEDLAVASPATVSRCGMIYMEPTSLGLDPLIWSWLQTLPTSLDQRHCCKLQSLFDAYFQGALSVLRRTCTEPFVSVNTGLLESLFNLLDCFLAPFETKEGAEPKPASEYTDLVELLEPCFLFSLIWSICCTANEKGRRIFDMFLRTEMKSFKSAIPFPDDGSIYDYMFNYGDRRWVRWTDSVQPYQFDNKLTFFEITVPTLDSICYSYLLSTCIANNKHFLLTGPTGTGKTVNISKVLQSSLPESYLPITLTFSAQTSVNQTQDMIDGKCEKRRKDVYGPPAGKKFVIFVDDINMPQKEFFGSQPPIELLRQWFDAGGWYDRKALTFRKIIDVIFVAACGHPGGGRNAMTARFCRHFNIINCTDMSKSSMSLIFTTILSGFLSSFDSSVSAIASDIVQATIGIYSTIVDELRPTPTKCHYAFNLRDISKIFQGLLMLNSRKVSSEIDLSRYWIHECRRVFSDRLVNETDRSWFEDLMKREFVKCMQSKLSWNNVIERGNNVICGDFMTPGSDNRIYEEIKDLGSLLPAVEEFLNEYNSESKQPMNLVLFMDALQHVSRLSRVLRQPQGNMLLLGVGGSGRQSLTRLATFMSGYKIFQVEIAKGYGVQNWREDVRDCLLQAGADNCQIVFLFNDIQIINETMLEDINNILNSGDVPNLYGPEEVERIAAACKPECVKKKLPPTKLNIYAQYLLRVRNNIHLVLCMSPMSGKFRERMRKFPSIINCCTIDWFSEWPDEALHSVATKILVESGISFDGHEDKVIDFVRYLHQSVSAASKQFLVEVKRYNFVTPTSFLELLSTYQKVINEKRNEVGSLKQRLRVGLEKLVTTAEQVEALQAQLFEMEPQLVKTQAEVEQMIIQIDHDRAEAAAVQKIVQAEESSAKQKAEETKAIADDAQRDLNEALPALDEAVACLKDLKKSDIDEVRAMNRPPAGVKLTMEATCIMFGIKPVKVNDPDVPGRKINDYFQAAQRSVLQDAKKLLEDMQDFDKDNIPDVVISAIDPYINSEDFTPDKIAQASKACKAICMWVRAMFKYHNVARMVEPKKRLLAQAQASLEITLATLAQAQTMLKNNLERLERLQNDFNEANTRKEQLARDVVQCRERLDRAQKLIGGLGGERVRWGVSCNQLEEAYGKLVGDALVCASTIAYAGPFTPDFRKRIVSDWRQKMVAAGIPHTDGCEIRVILGDPVQLRQWNLFNLPQDNHSIENAIILSKSRRYPLFIDPQGQANRFIRTMGKDAALCPNGMDFTKLTDKNFLRTIENGVRFGRWVLLENIGEELDAAIEPLLLQQKFKQGGQEMIKIGDSTIPWNDSFKFFMTSKLPNPHYPPEVCVKVSLLNFAVTFSGLEDQLLGVVIVEEMPEMEKKKNELVINNARMKKELKDIEDKILHLLSVSQGNILDDHQLIDTLASSKKTSDEIVKKVMEAEVTEKEIDRTREGFRPVAFRGSILFFMICDLSTIDPMYQFSAQWFTNLFIQAIKKSEPSPEIEKRIANLNDFFTYYTYVNICRGLFERHKLLLSFLMTIRILQGKNAVDDQSWQFLLTGKVISSQRQPTDGNPDASWIDNRMWSEILELSKLPIYSGLLESFQLPSRVIEWKKIYDNSEPQTQVLPSKLSEKLGSLEKICIMRCIRADKCPEAITNFVIEMTGQKYVEPPPFDLESCYRDSVPVSPLVFILSKGSDPTKAFYQFAARVKMDKKVKGLSLGQGQGEKASKMIEEAVQKGYWVYLQNCHLYISWLVELEKICESIQPDSVHRDFRLWLTSMPCKEFPVSILQNGVKMTNEPPRGLKANLKNAFFKLNNDSLNVTTKPHEYKKLLFGLCFFHAAVQERRKFGPLGWNIPYDFNDTDLDISRGQLELFLDSYSEIPFKVLTFLTSYINYGGRVTDYIDLRGIDVIMKCYYVPDILRDDYKFESTGTYCSVPVNSNDPHKGYMDHIDQLPLSANPEVFGLHENASITSALNETFDTLELLTSLQSSGGGSSKTSESREEILGKVVQDIQTKVGKFGKFDIDAISMIYPVRYDESMNTVLIQECIRYNKLIHALESTLPDLMKALKGLVVMSAELEAISNSLFVNQVPANWESKAYPSLKPLAAWTDDLVLRLQFISKWIEIGIPSVFWISGFFFPQAFLTGALQNFARKCSLPIDTVSFGFRFLKIPWEEKAVDGVYIRGLFMEGARWNEEDECLSNSMPKQLYTALPVIHLTPEQNRQLPKTKIYRCPVYKVLSRRGTLSTTGHSTNFIMWIEVPSNMKSIMSNQGFADDEVWIRAGVAAFCSLRY